MLHFEGGLHAKRRTLLDAEWLVLHSFKRARGAQVDGDVGSALDFKGQGTDDAASRVRRIDWQGGRIGDA